MGSAKFSLDLTDLFAVLKNGFFVALAAFITYLINNLSNLDFGVYTALIVPVVAMVLDTVVKWLKDNTKEKDNTKPEVK